MKKNYEKLTLLLSFELQKGTKKLQNKFLYYFYIYQLLVHTL